MRPHNNKKSSILVRNHPYFIYWLISCVASGFIKFLIYEYLLFAVSSAIEASGITIIFQFLIYCFAFLFFRFMSGICVGAVQAQAIKLKIRSIRKWYLMTGVASFLATIPEIALTIFQASFAPDSIVHIYFQKFPIIGFVLSLIIQTLYGFILGKMQRKIFKSLVSNRDLWVLYSTIGMFCYALSYAGIFHLLNQLDAGLSLGDANSFHWILIVPTILSFMVYGSITGFYLSKRLCCDDS